MSSLHKIIPEMISFLKLTHWHQVRMGRMEGPDGEFEFPGRRIALCRVGKGQSYKGKSSIERHSMCGISSLCGKQALTTDVDEAGLDQRRSVV
jgi:hypothetical protein